MQALRACLLEDKINVHTLRYHVQKEREKQEGKENANSREGSVILIDDDKSSGKEFSPLTVESDGATTTSTSSVSVSSKVAASSSTSTTSSCKKSRASSKQASQKRLSNKISKDEYEDRYKVAFKEATVIVAEGGIQETVRAMIARLNDKHELTGAKKLTKSTVYRQARLGLAGTSPKKMGPPSKIPTVFLECLATHTQVSQAGDGELKGKDIKRLISASINGSNFEGQFKTESVWKKLRTDFPESLQAANKMSLEDARAQWTTHDNLAQWFDDAKGDLLRSGMVIDRVILDNNGAIETELDFRNDDVKRRIVNMDETHHDLSITGDKGGTRSVTYHNPTFQRGPKRGVKSSRHVTGVYATSSAGEALPPMFIFDSGAKIEENFRVKMSWLDGLPTITGRFGCPTVVESSSFYAVRSKGSMDDSLLNDYITRVIFPLYPNMSKDAKFDTVTGKLLCGPVILKLDAGPGRIIADVDSILRREEFFNLGLIILMGLPNATSVQQEMDALYGPFKSATYARGEDLAAKKLKERGIAMRAGEAVTATLTLDFNDLATIVNGTADDPVEMKPFDKIFTKPQILSSWDKIGFVPFTRRCLENKKVRSELGQVVENVALERLQTTYDSLVDKVEISGFNPGIFDAAIPVARPVQRAEDEDLQVQQLLAQKGAFSASALWNVCRSRVGNAGVALRAQKEQLAMEQAKVDKVEEEKNQKKAVALSKAQSALEKYHRDIHSLSDTDWGAVVRWVLPAANVSGLLKDLKKKEAIIAKLATLPNVWTSYIPPREAPLEVAV